MKTLHHERKEQLSALTQGIVKSIYALNQKVLVWQKLYMEMLKFWHSLLHFLS
ncbi:hypothetical protein RvY_10914 [Ramazzottius varieornatus]|uniref:Uncharacterized protein n=1 Tax=Ramazzottius varieornatus TaxID=947166 RepID=A0A1D1VGD7_RAMVA|nr:hypothetical protein RvY_10914 [Ramazzottius varieornatus]